MPYKFERFLKACHSETDFVILDLLNDQFHIISDISVKDINNTFKNTLNNEITKEFLAKNWIQFTDNNYDQFINTKLKGFFDHRWKTPQVINEKINKKIILMALKELSLVNLKKEKFNLFNIYKEMYTIPVKHPISDKENIDKIILQTISSLNKVYYLDMTNNKCLTYSYILTKLLRNQNVLAKLKVGIRTRPFFSHAWVEVDNKIINDDKSIKNSLSVIMEI